MGSPPNRSGSGVTQAELARSLGIHQTTVSAILSGKRAERFAPEMRQRVIEAAHRLGYRPSASARALRGSRSGLIGVFHFGRDKDAESQRLHQIVGAIHGAGYLPLAMPMATKVMWLSKQDEVSACTIMLDSRVEGLILSGFADDFDLEQLKRFKEIGVPLVSVTGIKLPGIPFFGPDRYQAVYELTAHLIAQGRKKLVYLHRWSSALTSLAATTAFSAVDGFQKAARNHGLSTEDAIAYVKPSAVQSGLNAYEAGATAFAEIWESGARPDAVVCYDDSWALGVYGYCQRHGISIPDDVAVVGYESEKFGKALYPKLTSVRLAYDEMAASAVRCLTNTLDGGKPMPEDEVCFFPCSLVIEESCGATKPAIATDQAPV